MCAHHPSPKTKLTNFNFKSFTQQIKQRSKLTTTKNQTALQAALRHKQKTLQNTSTMAVTNAAPQVTAFFF